MKFVQIFFNFSHQKKKKNHKKTKKTKKKMYVFKGYLILYFECSIFISKLNFKKSPNIFLLYTKLVLCISHKVSVIYIC